MTDIPLLVTDAMVEAYSRAYAATWKARAPISQGDAVSVERDAVRAGLVAALTVANRAVGRCGDWCPTVTHAPRQTCVLPAGHVGWHRGDGDQFGEAFAPEWGPGPLSAPTTAERTGAVPEPTPNPAQQH
ncbi:hypothetical protein ACFYUR_18590 [Micromonospora haikouensis]|uniref:hypothetical protein n=1 Tax=Micromonospora haikouensis TaxID=686309 RepID=UPI0036CF2BE3